MACQRRSYCRMAILMYDPTTESLSCSDSEQIVPPTHPHIPRIRSRARDSPDNRDKPQQSTRVQCHAQERGFTARVQLQATRSI